MQDITLASLLDVITIGGIITFVIGAYKFYMFLKAQTIKDTDFKNSVLDNKKETEQLRHDVEKNEINNEVKMKEILIRVDSDKDLILKKIEEVDEKSEARFNKLTDLIIDLFKSK